MSSGEALLNDAMSAARSTIRIDIWPASLRAIPIGTSMFPNVPAASNAARFEMPILRPVCLAHL